MKVIDYIKHKIRGDYSISQLVERGMMVGKNFNCQQGVILDPDHCWLIEIGNNVTMAPNVHVLCHDASTKMFLGYTKIGRVTIGDNVFIGAGAFILPGVTIGSNVIVGANSTVTHDIPENSVVVGTPAKVICTLDEYLSKEKEYMQSTICYGEEYTLRRQVSMEKRMQQKEQLKDRMGYID